MNIGHSSKLRYDECYYKDALDESLTPGIYRLQEYQIKNCNDCLAPNGPRPSNNGWGVSTTAPFKKAAHSLDLVDDESFLSGRNLPQTKCRNGRVNFLDMSKLKLNNAAICDNKLTPENTHLNYPSKNSRSVPLNRFYNLHRDAQAPIFYDFAVNTTLEAKDNFSPVGPKVLPQRVMFPKEDCAASPYTLSCLTIQNREM